MRHRGQVILGALLVIFGLGILLGNLLGVNLWRVFWPLLFIGLGAWIILRPQMLEEGTAITQRLLGDVRRDGEMRVADEEILVLIGDVKLDLREAHWPEGETRLRIMGFVGDVSIRVPEDVGVDLSSTAFVSSLRWQERKEEGIFLPLQLQSEHYEMARKRLRVEVVYFIADVKIRWE
jgi:predicted membrane protein